MTTCVGDGISFEMFQKSLILMHFLLKQHTISNVQIPYHSTLKERLMHLAGTQQFYEEVQTKNGNVTTIWNFSALDSLLAQMQSSR